MNCVLENAEAEWDVVWSASPKERTDTDFGAWQRCEYPSGQRRQEKDDQRAYSVLLRYFRAYLDSQFIPCDVEQLWHDMQSKWQLHTASDTESRLLVETKEVSELEAIFNGLAERWRNETGGYALTYRRYAHPSYQAILTLGEDIVPLILRELQRKPDRWFEALKAFTKENPAANSKSFEEAVERWIGWGKEKKIIS